MIVVVTELWGLNNIVLDLELETENKTDRSVTFKSIQQKLIWLQDRGDFAEVFHCGSFKACIDICTDTDPCYMYQTVGFFERNI
jgi:hypothetical protein